MFGGTKLGLDNSWRLQRALEFPDRSYKTIHIAGTNGKGSVSTKIAEGLRASGRKVGLYTSPHISTFRERIRINGIMISENAVEELLTEIFHIIEEEKIPATFFEITTLLALKYFSKQNIDFAVLETGLGGRLDATNIVTPELSVITSISLDHTEILGRTLEEITREKAGIIKTRRPVIIGPRVPYTIIKEVAETQSSPIFRVNGRFDTFEDENRAIAQEALFHLNIDPKAIEVGIEGRQPCRFECFQSPCKGILDVAHNPDGLEQLFRAIDSHFPKHPIRVVFGLSTNKDLGSCLKILNEKCSHFHLVTAPNGRGAPVKILEEHLVKHQVNPNAISIDRDIRSSMAKAIQGCLQEQQLLLVCGSFFIMHEARRALGIHDPHDQFDMNERTLLQIG